MFEWVCSPSPKQPKHALTLAGGRLTIFTHCNWLRHQRISEKVGSMQIQVSVGRSSQQGCRTRDEWSVFPGSESELQGKSEDRTKVMYPPVHLRSKWAPNQRSLSWITGETTETRVHAGSHERLQEVFRWGAVPITHHVALCYSTTSPWQPEISHGGSIHTTVIDNLYKSEFWLVLFWFLVLVFARRWLLKITSTPVVAWQSGQDHRGCNQTEGETWVCYLTLLL